MSDVAVTDPRWPARQAEAKRLQWDADVSFINERGRPIELRLGRWPSALDPTDDVYIGIQGPDSLSENVLTLREARELVAALQKVIA